MVTKTRVSAQSVAGEEKKKGASCNSKTRLHSHPNPVTASCAATAVLTATWYAEPASSTTAPEAACAPSPSLPAAAGMSSVVVDDEEEEVVVSVQVPPTPAQ